MQTIRTLKRGVTYIKTVSAYCTYHTFRTLPSAGVMRKGRTWSRTELVHSVVVVSKVAYEAHRAKGHIWSAGDGAKVIWKP